MTTTAGDVMITVSPPLDRNAQVRIVEKAGDAPTSGTFEAALRIVSPDDVGWLAGAYRELAPYPDKTSQSIDLPTGTVSVSHEVTDGVSLWTMTFWPNYPVDPEDFPGEEPLE